MEKKNGLEYLDCYDTVVEPNGDFVGIFAERDAPCAFESVRKRVFYAICAAIPQFDGAVFATTDDDGQVGMEDGEGDVVGVTFHSLHATLAVVIPDFD